MRERAVALIPPLVLVFLPFFPSLPALAAPRISFEAGAVVASGVTPGGGVAWLTASRGLRGWVPWLAWDGALAADQDGDGVVRFAVEGGVSPMSVWMAVDLAGGEVAVASPEGWQPPGLAVAAQPLGVGASGRLDRVVQPSGEMLVFVARPGEAPGVWEVRAVDGGAADEAAAPGALEVPLAALRPLGESPPAPEELLAGDVVLLIHPRSLATALVVVDEGALAGAVGGE
jgi:hypothetical protein